MQTAQTQLSRLSQFSQQSFEQFDPKEGISGIKIDLGEIGHVPGTAPHWQFELKQRIQAIEQLSDTTLVDRWLSRNDSERKQASGEIMYRMHKNSDNKELYHELTKNPKDSDKRLQMVWNLQSSKQDFNLEEHRELYLQAMTACSLYAFDTMQLRLALAATNRYFTVLAQANHFEYQRQQNQMREFRKHGEHPQLEKLEQRLQVLEGNQHLLEYGIRQSDKVLRKGRINQVQLRFNLEEILHQVAENNRTQELRQLVESSFLIIDCFRSQILLLPQIHLLFDLFLKALPYSSLTHYLKGKLFFTELVWEVEQIRAYQNPSPHLQVVKDRFKYSYYYFGKCVRMLEGRFDTKTGHDILLDYASLVHYFYKVSYHILAVHLPREWLMDVFRKVLKQISKVDSPSMKRMVKLIEDDLESTRLAVEAQTNDIASSDSPES